MVEIVDSLPVQTIGPRRTLRIGQTDNGLTITAMYTHPWGLLVVRNGRRLIIPSAKISYVEVAEDEA